MIASQFNLDHRLAELRQMGDELRTLRAVRASGSPVGTVLGAIRSLLGGAPVAARPAGLAAR